MEDRRDPPRFNFIERHQEQMHVFWCTHPELSGGEAARFAMHKPNFGRDMELERIKSAAAGPSPTAMGSLLAEWYGVLSVAFGEAPEIELYEVIDNDLIEALYSEVVAYWAIFRRKEQA